MGKNIKKETKVLKEAKAKRYTGVLRIVRVTEALAVMDKRVLLGRELFRFFAEGRRAECGKPERRRK